MLQNSPVEKPPVSQVVPGHFPTKIFFKNPAAKVGEGVVPAKESWPILTKDHREKMTLCDMDTLKNLTVFPLGSMFSW